MENMKDLVKKALVEVNENTRDKLDSNTLISDGVLDSLDIMNLIIKLEEEFEIEIDPEDVLSENFESIDTIVALINKCKN